MLTFFLRHPVVVVGGGGVHSDNRGTYSFTHLALLGSHENFRFKIVSGENFGFGQKF